MGTDGIVLIFLWPMLFCLVALTASYFLIDKSDATPKKFKSIGLRRTALGLSGAMFAIVFYSAIEAISIGLKEVEAGHITYLGLLKSFPGYCLYTFSLFGPFLMVGAVIFVIPMLLVLARLRFASLAGTLFLSILSGVIYSAYIALNPYNIWCKENTVECVSSSFWSGFIACFFVAMGFSLAARFPIWRSPENYKED